MNYARKSINGARKRINGARKKIYMKSTRNLFFGVRGDPFGQNRIKNNFFISN